MLYKHPRSTCSRPCDGGVTTRYRHVQTMPKNYGKSCAAKDSLQIEKCNEK